MGNEYKIPKQVIYVCTGSKCKKRGGKEISKAFRDLTKSYGMKDSVEIIKTDCTDRCKLAPVLAIQPNNIWFTEVHEFKVKQIFQEQVLHSGKTPKPEDQ